MAGVKDAVDPGITYSMGYAEWQACEGVGLDLWAWENGTYPRWFKVRIMAFYNLSKMIELQTDSEVAKKSAPKGRRK